MDALPSLLRFVELTHRLQKVTRVNFAVGEDRHENDSEHMYQLALAAWYILSTKKLSLDLDKVLRYALAHDITEAYTGDLPAHGRTPEAEQDKRRREKEALQQIAIDFPDFTDITKVVEIYESRSDEESRFVYAVDKLLPMMNAYLDGGRSWKEWNITLNQVCDLKDKTVAVSPDIYPYWEELRRILRENESKLFPANGAE